jgi:hypothetical protein
MGGPPRPVIPRRHVHGGPLQPREVDNAASNGPSGLRPVLEGPDAQAAKKRAWFAHPRSGYARHHQSKRSRGVARDREES